MGILIVAALFIVLIVCGIRISINMKDKFGKNLAFGIIFGIAFQCLLNLMVVVGLIPVTGYALLLYS